MFEDLSAGTPYTARVLTLAGPLNASSELITNATCEYGTRITIFSDINCRLERCVYSKLVGTAL